MVIVCLFVSLYVSKNFQTDLHKIFREGCPWATLIKFWWRSGSARIRIRIWIRIRMRIATLVRRALVEVCTVPVLVYLFYLFVFH